MALIFRNKNIFYGWIIVASCTIITAIFVGTRLSFGVFFKSLAGEFQLTRLATSSVASVYMVLSALFAILSGLALDKYGPRIVFLLMGLFTGMSLLLTSQVSSSWQLYLSYSLLLALGTGGSIPVITSTVSKWFNKKRGLALGFANSGGSIGTIAIAPIAAYLIVNLDWRASCMIIGAVALLIVIPLCMLLRNDPSQIGVLPDGVKLSTGGTGVTSKEHESSQKGFSLLQALRVRSFWFMFFVFFFYAASLFLIFTHLVPYATDRGISPIDAAILLSIISGSCVVSRIITGRISDYTGRKWPGIISALLQAGALLCLNWFHDEWIVYVFAVIFGFSWGGGGVSLAMAADIFSGRSLGLIMGVLELGFLLGAAAGPVLGGYIFDMNSNYAIAFAAGAAMMAMAAILIALTREQRIK